MEFVEVEHKFVVPDIDAALGRITELRAESRGASRFQCDVYYDAPDRSFLANPKSSEWLRLRFESDTVTLSYKLWHPVAAEVKSHCDEFETIVSNDQAMERILTALGYRELVVVSKTRQEWRLGDTLIAIDLVRDLGHFIELEYVGDATTVDEAHRQLTATVELLDLDLGPRSTGYPHQLLARVNAGSNAVPALPDASASLSAT